MNYSMEENADRARAFYMFPKKETLSKMEKSDIMVSSTLIGETNDMTITHIPTGIAVNGYAERMLEHRPLRERLMRELEEKFQHYMANRVER